MSQEYTLVPDLTGLIAAIEPDSIISRTFLKGDRSKGERMKAMVFGFDAGQELSEHTAKQAAILQILQGEAAVTLGSDAHELSAGSWVQMPPNLKHSVYAKTPLIMLLLMFDAE